MTTAEPKALPPGWVETKLGDLHPEFQNGLSKRVGAAGTPVTVLRLADVKNDRLSLGSPRRILLSDAEKRKYAVTHNDLLAIRVNGSAELVGRFVLQSFPDEALAYCDHFIRLRFQEGAAELRFINYMSKGSYVRQQIESNFVTTAGQKTINQGHIAGLTFPLPPLAEQIRIADKLDTLLSRVDAGRERLERVPKLLKAFRRSVLNDALRGEYETQKLQTLLITAKTGPFGSALHQSDYITGGTPVINPMHINDGEIVPTEGMTVPFHKAEELDDFRLRSGGVIIGRRGVMGRCAVIEDKHAGWLCGTGSMILYPTKQLDPRYLALFLRSPRTVEALEADSVGSTMINLNQKILLALEIPLPTRQEQVDIVRRVEALFAIADRLETRYRAALTSFDRLTPALLAKAFRGELVPQDPNDEPASVLLERIQAQRASAPEKVKRGQSSTASKATADQGEAAPARRRSRPRKSEAAGAQTAHSEDIPKASSFDDAVRLLEERKLAGTR